MRLAGTSLFLTSALCVFLSLQESEGAGVWIAMWLVLAAAFGLSGVQLTVRRGRRLTWSLAVLVAIAGATIAGAPFKAALGPDGPPEHYPGSIIDLKPIYAACLITAGSAIGLLSLLGTRTHRVAPVLLAAGTAVVVGLSLDAVNAVIDNRVIERSYSVLELRGRGPITVAGGAAASVLLALGLTANLARSQRVSRSSPSDQTRLTTAR